jgi:hypothetical protein
MTITRTRAERAAAMKKFRADMLLVRHRVQADKEAGILTTGERCRSLVEAAGYQFVALRDGTIFFRGGRGERIVSARAVALRSVGDVRRRAQAKKGRNHDDARAFQKGHRVKRGNVRRPAR